MAHHKSPSDSSPHTNFAACGPTASPSPISPPSIAADSRPWPPSPTPVAASDPFPFSCEAPWAPRCHRTSPRMLWRGRRSALEGGGRRRRRRRRRRRWWRSRLRSRCRGTAAGAGACVACGTCTTTSWRSTTTGGRRCWKAPIRNDGFKLR